MSKKPRKSLRGKSLWGFGAAAIYIGFVLLILSMVMYASMQDYQLVDAGYYEQGLNYQDKIDRRNRSSEAEQKLQIEHRYGSAEIVVTLARPEAAEAAGTIRMRRPSNARLDRQWELSLNDSGQQVLSTEGMIRGQWRMEIEWNLDSIDYFDETRIVIP